MVKMAGAADVSGTPHSPEDTPATSTFTFAIPEVPTSCTCAASRKAPRCSIRSAPGRTTCSPAVWSRSPCSGCCGCPCALGWIPYPDANLLSTASSSFQMLPANLTLILFAAAAAFGQTADSPAPAFDVASVKASQPGQPGPGGGRGRRDNIQVSPGTVTMRNVSLKSSIRWAWHVSEFQVSGPDWLDSERYEIAGKAPGPATEEQLRLMMQTLLRERFKLALHRQTKELSAYV